MYVCILGTSKCFEILKVFSRGKLTCDVTGLGPGVALSTCHDSVVYTPRLIRGKLTYDVTGLGLGVALSTCHDSVPAHTPCLIPSES